MNAESPRHLILTRVSVSSAPIFQCATLLASICVILAGCSPSCPPPEVDREEFDLPGFGKMVAFTLPDPTVECPFSQPAAIPLSSLNNNRQLVINAPTGGTCTFCPHALLAQDGVLEEGTAIAHLSTAINDAGLIALVVDDRAAVWESGSVTLLPIEGYGNRSSAVAVDDSGAVLGTIQNLVEDCLSEGCPRWAVRWERIDGTWTINPLFELTHFVEEVSAMNNRGVVAGVGATVLSSYYDWSRHPFVWVDGAMSLLPTLGGEGAGFQSLVSDINDAGWIVGYLDLPPATGTTNPPFHAVLWRDGEVIDLGTLGGSSSWAGAVNNLGQVVGVAATSAEVGHAFLWQDGTMRDLNELIPSDLGIKLSNAIDITDAGDILAVSSDGRLLLMTPAR